ncbi:uncharacterized protein LOC120681036 [Panicum virgatum]|uniref:DUF1618 domain-containing protein n=1 Tax=Panicum virgatum TaxID=38727 RepID=A0A8T0PT00_PANVG|nr:uncharacterized protein LOC120681036 [Panicum virgatum]KAG2565541.1 hypothetical protein PVAP13_7NG025900 [Panicum virgatum]
MIHLPSLKLVPIPPDLMFSDGHVALLRCREQDMFYFAVLHRVIGVKYNDRQFDLHLYNSKTGRWNTESMHVDSQDFSYSYTSTVLAMGGEFGSVGWVDLWRGILICDLLRDKHTLRYIPLPLPLVPKPLKGYPLYIRNIIVLEDYIKFFEMHYVRQGSRTACTGGSEEGLVAATKKMKNSDIGSGNSNWEEDCTIKFSEIPVDSLKFAQVLLNLKQINGTKLTLNRLHAGYPALSLHEADVVYVMHTPDPDEDKASVIAVDMKNKILKDVADFGSGRPLGYNFTYIRSGISKHLNVWSSSR